MRAFYMIMAIIMFCALCAQVSFIILAHCFRWYFLLTIPFSGFFIGVYLYLFAKETKRIYG